MNGSIYVIKNKINSKVYVGQTIQGTEERFKQHLKLLKTNEKQLIHKAIKKYGKDAFYCETLISGVETFEELNKLEEYFILEYNSVVPNGYNLCYGGSQSRKLSNHLSNDDEMKIVELYKKGYSTRKIESETGVSRRKVSIVLKKHGQNMRDKACNLPDRSSKVSKEILLELYIKRSKTPKEIANLLGVSYRTINRRISTYGLREYNTKE